MHPRDWGDLISQLPKHLRSLRPGASEATLATCERRLGIAVPDCYRGFLSVSDGGWLGESRIYGSVELLEIAKASPVIRGGGVLLPFHPVSKGSVECLDLARDGVPVVWCAGSPRTVWSRPRASAGAAVTYVDFLDWFLDEVYDLHFPQRGGQAALAGA